MMTIVISRWFFITVLWTEFVVRPAEFSVSYQYNVTCKGDRLDPQTAPMAASTARALAHAHDEAEAELWECARDVAEMRKEMLRKALELLPSQAQLTDGATPRAAVADVLGEFCERDDDSALMLLRSGEERLQRALATLREQVATLKSEHAYVLKLADNVRTAAASAQTQRAFGSVGTRYESVPTPPVSMLRAAAATGTSMTVPRRVSPGARSTRRAHEQAHSSYWPHHTAPPQLARPARPQTAGHARARDGSDAEARRVAAQTARPRPAREHAPARPTPAPPGATSGTGARRAAPSAQRGAPLSGQPPPKPAERARGGGAQLSQIGRDGVLSLADLVDGGDESSVDVVHPHHRATPGRPSAKAADPPAAPAGAVAAAAEAAPVPGGQDAVATAAAQLGDPADSAADSSPKRAAVAPQEHPPETMPLQHAPRDANAADATGDDHEDAPTSESSDAGKPLDHDALDADLNALYSARRHEADYDADAADYELDTALLDD